MQHTDAIVIGAGQAGLAMSHCLSRRGIDHAVLDRGRVGERWRSERWDSLRLLTPNWMSRLPGWQYRGPDPDGYMTMPEVVRFLEGYARAGSAPVETGVTVHAVERAGDGYRVETDQGVRRARAVVVATGHCDVPMVPAMARDLPADIHQITPSRYRNPDSLPDGGVLVVGASATGVQLAEELHRSGRPVTLSVGRHTRLPRLHRGRDIMWWMDRIGVLDERADRARDLGRARAQPSLQLVGHPDRRTIDLAALHDQGVRVVGRTAGVDGGRITLCDDLAETTAAAQATMDRLLARIDAFAGPSKTEGVRPIALPPSPSALDLRAEGIRSVVWATGFRRDYGWLKVPVLDAAGEVIHHGGVTPSPGLYVLGLRFLRRRKSNFIDGVGADAEELAEDILGHLAKHGLAKHGLAKHSYVAA
ncbi:NAD(P)-binding domain-containing protein [Azospirillum soli]|uniref:NAD(P)-binding domain-containing protein n=1 Tax=Azospirillum soli TaxID=1304799 RepID=UPI001AE1FCAF|nr:NAD(P)-binding domain-containing protein [Azospirillum soli]MBP2314563.1 putative flavoprotein involved in K+ transport [Azospirillum soli]